MAIIIDLLIGVFSNEPVSYCRLSTEIYFEGTPDTLGMLLHLTAGAVVDD